jgi:type I restriction enzyme R subunit
VVLVGRLREAIRRLNPAIPEEAREEALRKALRVANGSLVQTSRGPGGGVSKWLQKSI